MFEKTSLEEAQFQTAAAKIKNQPGLQPITERPMNGGADEARLFFATDHFELDARLSAYAFHQMAIVSRFACSSSGDGTVGRDAVAIHAVAKFTKSAGRAADGVFVEQAAGEGVMTEPDRCAFAIQKLKMMGRRGSRDYEANRVGARINRCQMNGCGHSSAPKVRQCVRRLVMRAANAKVRRDSLAKLPVHVRHAAFAIHFDKAVPF